MNQELRKLFVSSTTTSTGLEGRIMVKVEKAARQSLLEKIAAGGFLSITFAVVVFVIGRGTAAEVSASGFSQYISLVFTDSKIMFSNWSDFGWTIAESAPVTGLALSLAAVGMFVAAIRWTGRSWSGFNGAIGKLAV